MVRRREEALPEQRSERRLTSIEGGRGVEQRAPREADRDAGQESRGSVREQTRMWHVVLSVAGAATPLPELRTALEKLAHDHSFFLTARYAADHAEVRYWEEARDLHDAAAIALRLWGEHKASAKLPAWEIVGLEVVDRPTYHKRVAEGFGDPPPQLGGVHPY
ncbi:hypothetical protein Kpho02_45130 [Kitasatospora phosalacinea]|uniref:Uncharacterized protein n=1 Tax=Kitasatospora phosalacinea TaxID=2065 RepID=A0A9W6V1P2_9ACTN|nr:hypothetical protein [Kitasatospora phosalacinea]GLW72214.1 hypothetical protein Kpho02_45130 [Kitasatospora phosalacinea]